MKKTGKYKPQSKTNRSPLHFFRDTFLAVNSNSLELRIFSLMLFLFPFLLGLFFEFTAAFTGIVLSLFLCFLVIRKKTLRLALNFNSILLLLVFFSYLLVIPWSVDWGMSLIGWVKFSVPILFMLVVMQFEEAEIRKSYAVIPLVGIIMVILSVIAYFIPFLADILIDAGRLGGFFQYPNTFALFLMIGMLILLENKPSEPGTMIQLVILTLGIILTGSRISLVMLVILFLFYALSNKALRKTVLLLAGGSLLVVSLFLISGLDFNTINRLTEILTNPSTLLGRFLYARDGLLMLLENPLGVGYLGYYYLQPQYQTGVYTVKFIHNTLLQLGLDAGIPAMLAFIAVCFNSFFHSQMKRLDKLIFIVILAHSFLDMDFQYLVIVFIFIMTLSFGERKSYLNRKWLGLTISILVILTGFYTYFLIALSNDYLGKQNTAYQMMPFDTEIKIYALSQAGTTEAVTYWADSILSSNQTISLAYKGKAMVAAEEKNYEDMFFYMKQSINWNPYDLGDYQFLLAKLSETMTYYNAQGDLANVKKYAEIALDIPNQLDAMKTRTSWLGTKITDQPELELSDTEKQYLKQLQEYLEAFN